MEELDQIHTSYLMTVYFFILFMTLSFIFYMVYYMTSKTYQSNQLSQQRGNRSFNTQSISSIPVISSTYGKILLIISQSFLWYAVSISFTVYNKWLLQLYKGGFHYPFTITLVHMTVKFIFSRLWVYVIMTEPVQPLRSSVYVHIVIPIGVTTALDIAFSNLSVSYLTLSLYTILKTTVVAWTFIWGTVFNLEIFSLSKASSILGLVLGLSLALISDVRISPIGVIASIASAACGGLRWVFVQLLQTQDEPSKLSIIAVYRFAAITVIAMIPLVGIFEMSSLLSSSFVSSFNSVIEVFELVFFGGLIGCILIIVELNLLNLTSSLTLSIIGEMKEVIQIALSMIAFHDQFSWISGLGITLAITSAEVYRKVKTSENNIENNSNNNNNNHVEWRYDDDAHISVSKSSFDVDDMELMKLINDTEEES